LAPTRQAKQGVGVVQFIVLTPVRMAIAAGNEVFILLSIVMPPH
jgi:hypothetical protein